MFSCNQKKGTCCVDPKGTQTQAACAATCKPAPPPAPTPKYRCCQITGKCWCDRFGKQSATECAAACKPVPPPPPTPAGECHACMSVPGRAWCWTSNSCLEQPNLSACDYTHQVCNNVQYCKCKSCTDPVCGSPFACIDETCIPSASGLPELDCQKQCGAKFRCVSNKCIPGDVGLPQASCEANCGPRALRGFGAIAFE
jgi:hypothetical protein